LTAYLGNTNPEGDDMSQADVDAITKVVKANTYPFKLYQLWEPNNADHSIYVGAPGIWYHVPDPGYLGILRSNGQVSPDDADIQHVVAQNFLDYAGSIFKLPLGTPASKAGVTKLEKLLKPEAAEHLKAMLAAGFKA
jgi:hypothetical protein